MSATLSDRPPSTYREALVEVRAERERRLSEESLAEEADRLSRDFYAFVIAAWPLVLPREYVETWHVRTICEHLQALYHRDLLRLAVTIPPGYLKSSLLSVFGPSWLWTWKPESRVMGASHSHGLAARDARRSRMLVQTEWYQRRWPLGFADDENATTRYSNLLKGHRVTTHVGGGTGDRGDVLQLDDPHNAMELHSEVMLQSAWDWMGESWFSRLDDSVDKRGVMVVIGQRIAPEDVIGHLLAGDEGKDRWTHLCLPAEYEPAHPFVYPAKVKTRSGNELQGDVRKKRGDLLAPTYMDKELLESRTQDMTRHTYAAQYQQRPAPLEGNLLKRALWRYYPPDLSYYAPRGVMQHERLPEFQMVVNSWDTSVKDRKHSDYVSGQCWGCIGADRWLLRLFHARAGLNATIEAMIVMHEWALALWPDIAHFTVVEESANGPDAMAVIRRRMQGVTGWPAKGSKVMRAQAAQPALESRNCFLPGYPSEDEQTYDVRTPADVQAFIEELAIFDPAVAQQQDDQVDAWSQMVNWTRGRLGGVSMSVPVGVAEAPRFHVPLREQDIGRAPETALRPQLRD